MVPCSITAPNECLWTDWLIERRLYGHQARHYACIKRSDGTCSWYRGGPPPEKEFIDISEPWNAHFSYKQPWEAPSTPPCTALNCLVVLVSPSLGNRRRFVPKSPWGWHRCRTRDKNPPGGTCCVLCYAFAQRAGNCPPRRNKFPFFWPIWMYRNKRVARILPPPLPCLITCRLRAPPVFYSKIFPMNYGMFYRTIIFFFFFFLYESLGYKRIIVQCICKVL